MIQFWMALSSEVSDGGFAKRYSVGTGLTVSSSPSNPLRSPTLMNENSEPRPLPSRRGRFSLRQLLLAITMIALVLGNVVSILRLRKAESALSALRAESGYLSPSEDDLVAAIRAPSHQPLTTVFRVRVPESLGWEYRLAYSTWLPKGKTQPDWYSMIAVRPGESVITVRIAEDPRDERWKISTLVRDSGGVRRMGTTLPEAHTAIFRASHDVISTGVAGSMVTLPIGQSLRILDDRWLVGDESLLLSGDKPVDTDQIGVYAELQPVAR
ncbi:hypothetical protein [Rhodopirellula sp. P2]|uniref:hypothetical protein n=1 Tax=Rhodopirellula sp. P2 TaxID=2127060 RepID=UPI002368DF26|nr:hypothetical protein [Rhodopirellula sp. P2]WDQ16046.1 hypothetical protein PSR62_20790 [Rhodopirellula sp. P2]